MLILLQAESLLSLVHEQESPSQINSAPSPPKLLDLPDANVIIRSTDLGYFRLHKSVLALVSPFFKDLLSLPQPSDGETVDGLPVVQLSEDSELLNTLVSILYPVRRVIPRSYEKVLFACDLSVGITNRLLQGAAPTRSVSEIRDDFGAVIHP
jgi:hypothetical protein